MPRLYLPAITILSLVLSTAFKPKIQSIAKSLDYRDTTKVCHATEIYVDRQLGKERRKWYKKHQRTYLKTKIGKNGTKKILFSLSDFNDFLKTQVVGRVDTLRMYIAIFPDSNDYPSKLRHNLTVVFVPVHEGQEIGYYTFDPNKQNAIVTESDAKEWIDAYDKERMPIPDSKENDTKFVFYTKDPISWLQGYIQCSKDVKNATGMKIYFSSYQNETREKKYKQKYNANVEKYYNRMTLQFEVTKKILFFRKELNPAKGQDGEQKILTTNNGTLCPPCTNCPPGTSGCEKSTGDR